MSYLRAMKRRRFVIMRGCLRSEAALGMPLDELLATNVAQ